MKLDKKGIIFLAMVAVIFIVFNVVFFAAASFASISNPNTIISWVFMFLGFVSFFVFTYLSGTKPGVRNLVFMRFTLLGHCVIFLIVDFVLAVFFTVLAAFVDVFPAITGGVLGIALAIHIVIALACLFVKTAAEDVGKEVKQRTSRMKGFRVEAEMLVEYCTDASAKDDFRKFAEAVRYSDPMSCDALTEVEDSLEEIISDMKRHLMAGEIAMAQDKCKTANNILKERNRKCLLFK